MRIAVTTVTPLFPTGIYVQWDYVPDPNVTGTFLFRVERSGSPEGPWTDISGNLPNQVSYVDTLTANNTEKLNLASVARELYYRVTVTAPNAVSVTSAAMDMTGERVNDTLQTEANTNPFAALTKRKFLLRRKILRDESIQFRALNGTEALILKRRHFGQRCTVCFDQLTKMTTKGQCTTCYGTSWIGGYYTPISTFVRWGASPIQSSLTNEGKMDINSNGVTLLNYPKVEEGDLIITPDGNTRWVIKQIGPTSLKGLVVHQRVMAMEIPRTNVEYKLPI